MPRLTGPERRLCETLINELPQYRRRFRRPFNTELFDRRYLIAFGLVLAAILVTEWSLKSLGAASSTVALIAATALSLRIGGAGPGWFAVILGTFAVAWMLPPEHSLLIDAEYMPRFIGLCTGQLALMLARPGAFGERYASRAIRFIKLSIKAIVSSSLSLIGRPASARSPNTS